MCGIVGQINQENSIDRSVFDRMVDSLQTRGPDGRGVELFNNDYVALGHRRLSIIDLSEHGRQPMTNEDGTVWLTYNGEIYNFQELRRTLVDKGHVFRSNTDSEVIIHGYEEWGDAVVSNLRGIFAFGIWDCQRERLLLARDQIGVKPLYYSSYGQSFAFASQPKAILEDPNFDRHLDYNGFSSYLAFGVVHQPHSVFQGLVKLPPAHYAVFEQRKLRTEKYWELKYQPSITRIEDAVEVTQKSINNSIGRQLMSDVPVGVFLSGGIDSSAIAEISARESGNTISSFTIGFKNPDKDERAYARITAEHAGTQHIEHELDEQDVTTQLRELIENYDEPFSPSSALPTTKVSQLAAENDCKVILGGDGGDELFCGYLRYDWFHNATSITPRTIARYAIKTLIDRHYVDPIRDPMSAYFSYLGLLTMEEQKSLLTQQAYENINDNYVSRLAALYDRKLPAVTSVQNIDFHSYLVDDILTKVDRASMSCGVEVRVPFLDLEVVESAFKIDSKLHYQGKERKAILKRAISPYLDPRILSARKQGFSLPIKSWAKEAFTILGDRFLLDGFLTSQNYISHDYLKQNLKNMTGNRLWQLLVAELWARRWLSGESMAGLFSSQTPVTVKT